MRYNVFKSFFLVLVTLSLVLVTMLSPSTIHAASVDCATFAHIAVSYDAGPYQSGEISQLPVTVNLKGQQPGTYQVRAFSPRIGSNRWGESQQVALAAPPTEDLEINFVVQSIGDKAFTRSNWAVTRQRDLYLYNGNQDICKIGSYAIDLDQVYCGPNATVTISQERTINGQLTTCYLHANSCIEQKDYTAKITGLMLNEQPYTGKLDNGIIFASDPSVDVINGTTEFSFPLIDNTIAYALERTSKYAPAPVSGSCGSFKSNMQAVPQCPTTDCNTEPVNPQGMTEINFKLCEQASGEAKSTCEACFAKDAIWTAVGCIETTPRAIIESIVKIGIGIGGGIALIMTLVGGFILTTSQGDPKRTQEGREMITSSVIGLLFVLFSVVMLQFVGVTIFKLPGFGM